MESVNTREKEAEEDRYDLDDFQIEKVNSAVDKLQEARQKLQEARVRHQEVRESVNDKFALICHSMDIDFESNEVEYDRENGQLVVRDSEE